MIMLAAVVLLGILAVATSGSRTLSWAESTVGAVVQPVQTFAVKASDSIINFFRRVFKTTDADRELEQLLVRYAQLEDAEQENKRLEVENARLKELLNYVDEWQDHSFVTATVIGNSQGVWFNVFTINAGRNRGIEKDMPVVCPDGLVGRVSDVGATWSKVTSVIDPASEVSVMVERTRDIGMAKGLFDTDSSYTLAIYYLPSGFDLVPGDVMVTSGMGSIFPKGVTVGTVSEVTRQSESGEARNAVIVSTVDFSHLEEVVVITAAPVEE